MVFQPERGRADVESNQRKMSHVEQSKSWVGVDFDGCLAYCTTCNDALGEPVPKMLRRVKTLLAAGFRVKIFTARVDGENPPGHPTTEQCRELLKQWCVKHIGQELEITNRKDCYMIALYDDRAVGIETDTGNLRFTDLL